MVDDAISRRAKRVRLMALDVDGVLTDGSVYYSTQGEELKRFHIRDGMGIVMLMKAGVEVVIITREATEFPVRRAEKLGIKDVYTGVHDKKAIAEDLLSRHGIGYEEMCYVGDDINDLEILEKAGLAVAVRDALPEVREAAHYVTERPGGNGAVREVCDLILAARGIDVGSLL
ncbi:MAG: HAD-IIIA family hydrolase [Dehalococcoidia bacterium]